MSAANQPMLYVENSLGGDISVADLEKYTEVHRIEVGGEIDDIVADPKRRHLLLSRKHPTDVVAVSPDTGEIVWSIDMPGIPHHVQLSADGDRLFVPVFEGDFVEVIDLDDPSVVARVPVGAGPHGTRLSADGRTLYVGTVFANQLTLIDVDSLTPRKHIPFEEAVRPFATPDDKTMYVQLSKLHGFVAVDLQTGEQLAHVDLPALEPGTPMAAHDTYDHGLAVTPDGRFLYAVSTVGNYAAVYTVPDLEMVTVVPLGAEPNWIEFTLDGTRAIISNRADDTISIVSVEDHSEVARFGVGRFPQRMAEL